MSDPEELIPVNLWLAGRSYRIRIEAKDESQVRRSVKEADEKIAELRRHYAGKDDQDFVAMCLLMYATENAAVANQYEEKELLELMDKIDRILPAD